MSVKKKAMQYVWALHKSLNDEIDIPLAAMLLMSQTQRNMGTHGFTACGESVNFKGSGEKVYIYRKMSKGK
jgi:hypothetical protein